MKSNRSSETAAALLLVVLVGVGFPFVSLAAEPAASAPPACPQEKDAEPGSGMRVRREPPATSFASPETAGPARQRASGGTLGDDLIEVPAPSPGGGTMIRLKRRLLAGMTSRKEADGSAKAECRAIPPGSSPGE